MAESIHISEAEASRDFSAVMKHVNAGEEVVVEGANGVNARIAPEGTTPMRIGTIAEALAILKQVKETEGLAMLDDEFATDMDKIHAEMNQPLDSSKWD